MFATDDDDVDDDDDGDVAWQMMRAHKTHTARSMDWNTDLIGAN